MAFFRYETGDQVFDGSTGRDFFAIFGPDDDDEIYTVVANGQEGGDKLVFIALNPLNLTFNAGVGRDIAEFIFGDVLANFDLFMGTGNDQVIFGDARNDAIGSFNVELGSGQDEVIFYGLDGNVTISDFETGSAGDRFVFSNQAINEALADGFDPFSNGMLTLSQDADNVILNIQNDSQLVQSITFEGVNISDFTPYNFAGLSLSNGDVLGAEYTVEGPANRFAGPDFFAGLGDDTITVQNGVSQSIGIYGLAGNDIINGSSGRDDLYGGAGDDILNGNDGNDTLNYEVGGNDQLNGGAGNDLFRIENSAINGQEGRFQIILNGGTGDDRLIHIDRASRDVEFIGGAGEDITEIWASNATSNYIFDMGVGNDVVKIGSSTSNAFLRNGEGNYTLTLGDGNDEVQVNSVGISFSLVTSPPPVSIVITDFETGASGDFVTLNFAGQIGNWEEGENPFDVGAARILQRGSDAVLQFENYEYTSDFRTATAIGWSDVIKFEDVNFVDLTAENFNGLSLESALLNPTFNGTSQDDILTGRNSDDTLLGERGDDILNGGAGDDVLSGSLGEDDLNGGAGEDRLEGGSQNDELFGGTGSDILRGGSGDDLIDGWTGFDTALYTGLSTGVTVDLRISTAQDTGGGGVDTVLRVENLIGSGQDDTLIGSSNRNRLEGGNGNDILRGLGNNDTLLGGSGDDEVFGGTGVDRLIGGDGNDQLFGEDGRDRLEGGIDDDVISGGTDVDRLFGGDGNDVLIGGAGTDFLFGGSGADRFDFNSMTDTGVGPFQRDEIRDFNSTEDDKIDLIDIDANVNIDGNQTFSVASAGFTGTAGEIMIQSLTRSGINVQLVSLDVDGDSQADMQIWVIASELDAGDFVL